MTTHNTPLRIFMGLQMIGWGFLIQSRDPWSFAQLYDRTWLWAFTVVLSGLWLTTTALIEVQLHRSRPPLWTNSQRMSYRVLAKYTVVGYFFSGAAWGGIGIHAMQLAEFREVDVLCPLYMAFLLYLAFSDASKKRKGVELNNENKRNASAALFHGPGHHDSRLSAERHGR